jgi:hypothetical protein
MLERLVNVTVVNDAPVTTALTKPSDRLRVAFRSA